MPSFDVVSEADMSEVDNAIHNVMREISVRYDFKGSKSSVESSDGMIKISADDEIKCTKSCAGSSINAVLNQGSLIIKKSNLRQVNPCAKISL